jgi:hypothetical protein
MSKMGFETPNGGLEFLRRTNFDAPPWVCYKLVSEHGYNTWPTWAHGRVV